MVHVPHRGAAAIVSSAAGAAGRIDAATPAATDEPLTLIARSGHLGRGGLGAGAGLALRVLVGVLPGAARNEGGSRPLPGCFRRPCCARDLLLTDVEAFLPHPVLLDHPGGGRLGGAVAVGDAVADDCHLAPCRRLQDVDPL